MIVSGIWWKRLELRLKPVAFTPLLLLLGGCGAEQLLFGRPPAEAPMPQLPPSPPSASQTDVSAGLSPLPTPQQVLTAVPFGRSDPFAPLPAPVAPATASRSAAPGAAPGTGASGPAANAAGAASPGAVAASGGQAPTAPGARLVPPEGFRLTGVIRSGGRAEALVSFGPLSGSLRPGDRGGRSTALLPSGWALAAIQFGGRSPNDPPSITLRRGAQSVTVRL